MVILVTGGARSGKSQFAQSLFAENERVVYVATAEIYDEEMAQRVNLHRRMRPDTWRTEERPRELSGVLAGEEGCLLDCVTVLTSNIMFAHTAQYERIPQKAQEETEEEVKRQLDNLIDAANDAGCRLVLARHMFSAQARPARCRSRAASWAASRADRGRSPLWALRMSSRDRPSCRSSFTFSRVARSSSE